LLTRTPPVVIPYSVHQQHSLTFLGLLTRWPPTRISEARLSVMLAHGRGPRYGGGLLRFSVRVQPEQCRWRSGDI